MAHTLNPSTGRQRQVDLSELQARQLRRRCCVFEHTGTHTRECASERVHVCKYRIPRAWLVGKNTRSPEKHGTITSLLWKD